MKTQRLHLESLAAQGVELVTEELPPDKRPKYVTNYIGAAHGRDSSMRSHQHHYSISSRHGENSNALERLFICRKAKAMKQGEICH